MKIAIFIDSLAIGGAQKHVSRLATELSARGHDIVVYVLNAISNAMYVRPMREMGVNIRILGKFQVFAGVALFHVVTVMRRERRDVVISILFASTIFARLAAQIAGGIPVLSCLQARNVDYAWWQRVLTKVTANLTDITVSNSRSAVTWAPQIEGICYRQCRFVANAVEYASVEPFLSWAEIGLPQAEGKYVLGSLGRLNRQKGYDLLIDAFAQMRPFLPNSILVIFGEGPERGSLQKQISELGLSNSIFLPGEKSNASTLLQKFSLYIQPSRFEGTPNALTEALAARVVAVARNVDGIAEISPPHGSILYLYQGNSSMDLVEAIKRAMSDSRLPLDLDQKPQIINELPNSRDFGDSYEVLLTAAAARRNLLYAAI